MTISDLAKELGVSRGTIYNAIVKAGLDIDSLTEKKQGNKRILRADCQETVRSIVKEASKIDTVNDSLTVSKETVNADSALTVELTEKLNTYKAANEKLTEELEKAREDLARATAQHEKELQAASDQHAQDQATIDHLRGTVEAQTATIQAQAMTAAAQTATIQAMQQRLPAAPQTLRQAIAGWITSKTRGK